mgnify:CR=1 FL=1
MRTLSSFIFLLVLSLNLTTGCTAAQLAMQDTLNEQQDRFFQGALVVWATSAAALAGLLTRRPIKEDGRD